MALVDKFKSRKSPRAEMLNPPEVVTLTESDPADPMGPQPFSIPPVSMETVVPPIVLSTAPTQKDIYNLQTTEVATQQAPAPASVIPLAVDEMLRNYTPAQISSFIDASRAVTIQKNTASYPRISLTGPLPEFVIPTGMTNAPGQSPNAAPPGESSLNPNVVYRSRFPDTIVTDAYLNDPIQFKVDTRLYRNTVSIEIPSGSLDMYKRDIAQYVTVPLGTMPKVYSIATTSMISNRIATGRYIKTDFEEF